MFAAKRGIRDYFEGMKMQTQAWQKRAKEILQKGVFFWFRYQSGVFIVLLLLVAIFGMLMWHQYFYLLGKDEGRIRAILEKKQEILFDEDLYESLNTEIRRRESASGEMRPVQELFIRAPEESEDEGL